MAAELTFFNWSLRKTLASEPDNFGKARIRILFTILLFALLKVAVVLAVGIAHEQWRQVSRGIIAGIVDISLIKIVLYRPSTIKAIAHITIVAAILVVWSNVFVYAHNINLVTVQFVFMIALSSFYIIGTRGGLIYSSLAILPILMFLFLKENINIYFSGKTEQMASPGYEIVVVLNFLTILIAHYLFFEAINENIKEKEQLNTELQNAITAANQLAESKSNFLSTMSHELRTPLNSVVGITELLLDDDPKERQKENLKILQFSALDLLALINNVLDFNKLDSDKLMLESVHFNLAEFLGNICSVLRVKALNKQLTLVLDIDKRLERVDVISDATRLSQVIYNLVGNAVKFTNKGTITVRAQIEGMAGPSIHVAFSIEDTGVGIPRDKHESIFELFTQAKSHLIRKHEGSGLGLAIVKRILNLFGSTIHLESEAGKGSRFSFTIPFATTAASREPKVAAVASSEFGHLKILIAEDNDVNRLILTKQMERFNATTVMVENGKQAYDACAKEQFDAVFMDLHMPVLGGYETTKMIRALPDAAKAGVYIIAFTASVTELEHIMQSGFDDYLYKPVNMEDLRDKLEKISGVVGKTVIDNQSL